MRLSLRPATSHSVVHVDADGGAAAARVLTTLNAPTYAPLPTPKPTWSLASFALRALAGSLDALELDMADAPTLGLSPRADVLDDLLPADEEREEDPRIWAALALAYGLSNGAPRRMPLSDPHLFALPQPVVLDFSCSAPGMRTAFDDGAAVNLLAADLRALVLLDLSGQTGLTDRGLKALARAQGTRGLRALALRGCAGVGVEGVTACAIAWERLEVLDIRGTRCPKGTTIPGFAPRPPALLAESHFHPRSPEQVARALLGKDTPLILVDEEDFGRPARRRPVLDRPRLVDRAPPPVTAVPAPRVFTASMPEAGVLLVERPPPPPPPPPPEPSLPPEPTTMAELRARRLAAFGVAPPAPPAPAPLPAPLPAPPAPAPAAPASSSPWTRAPSAPNPLWNDLLARHQPQPHPHPAQRRAPRPDMVASPHIRAAGRAPARVPSPSPSPSRSSSRSRTPSPSPWALPSLSSPSPSPSPPPAPPPAPSPPPAKRPRLSNPYAGSKRKPRKREELAERARFAARLADEGALMFVRVGPPPRSSSPAQKVVREEGRGRAEAKVKIRSSADLRAHLAGVMGRRAPVGVGGGAGSGTGAGGAPGAGAGGVSGSAGGGAGTAAGAGTRGDGVYVGAGAGARASAAAPAPAAAPPSRRVPFAKAASGQKRGLSTWHGVLPDDELDDEDEDEVVEVPPPPRKSVVLGSKMQATAKPAAKSIKPALKSIKPAAQLAPKSTKPAAKPKLPSLNSGGGGAAARQTTLPFAKKPPSAKGKG